VRHGVRWAIAAVILMIAGVVAIWPRSEPTPAPEQTTQAAPDLTLARGKADLPACGTTAQGPADLSGITAECLADGLSVDVAQALGAPVLVNVWATWCEPCKTELPVLDEYAREPGAMKVITLAVQSKPADALELLAALDVHLPSLIDGSGAIMKKLHPAAIPASYLVKPDGTMAMIQDPRLFDSVDQVRQAAHG
jgi:thiol-disulfide isomerase/thioredoxin